MRQKTLETFSETRKRNAVIDDESPKSAKKRRASGSETINFLKMKADTDSELRKEELKIRGEELLAQRQMITDQQKILTDCMDRVAQQQNASTQQQNQMMIAQLQFQQQQSQMFTALIEKLTK